MRITSIFVCLYTGIQVTYHQTQKVISGHQEKKNEIKHGVTNYV